MAAQRIRCAIYTRKSSDDGLEQDFNSLDAQHEACSAYIASQKQEGWVATKTRYDDGGISGATLERPALARLLKEIEAGRIAMVVVYKIDRLTRSLADFVRLVERFDAAGCSFVSVTQAFNTASSMGRLTLNVLLSFAQFEREVTAERIRDKIAASKKLGMWMGGVPPLGYDPHPDPNLRELAVNDAEAITVKALFALYDRHGNLSVVAREAERLRLRSKHHAFKSGRTQGGGRLSNGQIHNILTNPIYRGQIRHKDKLWPGRHPAIIDQDLWDRVQTKLQQASRRKRGQATYGTSALLTGKLRDETGDRLTPTHSVKAGKRHRYYVSNRLIADGPDPTAWRLPAEALERRILDSIIGHIEAAARSHRLLASPDLRRGTEVNDAVTHLHAALQTDDGKALRRLLRSGTVAPDRLTLILDRGQLANMLRVSPTLLADDLETISANLRLRRRGVEAKLIIGDTPTAPDPVLLRTLRDAHHWIVQLKDGVPLSTIAREAGHHEVYIRTRCQLAFLSPRIQDAIVTGSLPHAMTLQRFMDHPIPLDWTYQDRLCGF